MRTIRIKIYSFNELSNESQAVAIDRMRDINVDFNWWRSVYEDAENIGLKITGFDLDKKNEMEGNFILSANEVMQNIFDNHGQETETFKTCAYYMEIWQPIFSNYFQTEEGEENLIEIENNFLNELLNDYFEILKNECEYLQTDEAITETIMANDYEFLADGTQY